MTQEELAIQQAAMNGGAKAKAKESPTPGKTGKGGKFKDATEEKEREQAVPTEEQNLTLVERLNNGRTAVQQAQAQQVTEFADAITNNMIDLAGPTIALQLIEKSPQAIEKGGNYLKAFFHSIPTSGMPIETVFEDTSSLTMEDPFFATLQLMESPTLTEEVSPIEELLILTEAPTEEISTEAPTQTLSLTRV